MRLFSPAKINLGLQVLHRRRGDGYHFLRSVFVPISFGDELRVRPAKNDGLSSQNELPASSHDQFEAISERGEPTTNLILKTLHLTRAYRKCPVHVHLTKRIPLGSGLGGGSSNAGVLLKWIFNHCLSEPRALSLPEPSTLALQLGSDVPFFLQENATLVSGVGEKQKTIAVGSGLGVLALPSVQISTAKAYRNLKRTLQPSGSSETWTHSDEDVQQALRASQWDKLLCLRNDFESVVFRSHKELRGLKEGFFSRGADFVLMSGSGSSVYALVKSRAKQKEVMAKMESLYPHCRFVPFHFAQGYGLP